MKFSLGDCMRMWTFIIKILCIISIITPTVFAYDYEDPNNQSSVESARRDIYSLKDMYEELAGLDDGAEDIVYEQANNNAYWWPIGSKETTTSNGKIFATGTPEETTITSTFGYRGAVIDSSGNQISGNANHGAIDIANMSGVNVTNVIAAKDGVVVYPTENDNISCVQGNNSCNGGYGNYVVIEHSDGNYTLYAHLATDSITVKSGENVSQGQVIAKIGSTGNSTGPHLHFEVRVGENTSSARVDPLEYVDPDNPRPSSTAGGDISDTIEFIRYWEGVGCGSSYQTDTEYIACDGGDGVLTIGHGVTWENNIELFQKYGINNVSAGTKVSKEIVDAIEVEAMNNKCGNSIRSGLANAGIDDLKDYQITVLISRCYNGGYATISGGDYSFIPAYLKYNGKYRLDEIYESSSGLWLDSMSHPVMPGSEFEYGLKRRRLSEWKLFTTGEIDYFEGFNSSAYVW